MTPFGSETRNDDQAIIQVRQIKPKLNLETQKFWFGGNPFATHLMNALSFVFPPGEETFVDSVNHFKEQIKDPHLRMEIRGFAGQEFMHSQLHEKLNDWISILSPSSKVYTARLKKFIEMTYAFNKKMSAKSALGATVGFEHLTAIMSASLLAREDVLAKMEPEIRNIYILHAIEEIEHKNVAFDVYKNVNGSWINRILTFIFASSLLFAMTFVTTVGLLMRDRRSLSFHSFCDFMRMTVGKQGFFTNLIPNYFRYFKPSFHPSQIQDQELLVHWSQKLAYMTEVKVIGKTKKSS